MKKPRPQPPRRANWGTCTYCGKRGWLTRQEAKTALKEIYPGQFQAMQVYRCREGGNSFHHGHRVPSRFRGSDLSSCRHCSRQIRREGVTWSHMNGRVECGQRDVSGEPLTATPYWQTQ